MNKKTTSKKHFFVIPFFIQLFFIKNFYKDMASGNVIAAWILGTLAVLFTLSSFFALIGYLVVYGQCKSFCKKNNCNGNNLTNPPGAKAIPAQLIHKMKQNRNSTRS